MRVAVTGGTGFIGRRVVRLLRERGHEVTCAVRKPEGAGALAGLGASVVPGDILDRASLDRAFQGHEAVMHLAASYEVGLSGKRAAEAMTQNLDGTRHALEAARDAGARRIVYTSSIVIWGTTRGKVLTEADRPDRLAFPDPHFSIYALSKARAHYEVAEPMMKEGVPVIAVSPGTVLGPGDHSNFHLIFELLAAGLPAPLGPAAYTVVSVEDCALGHVLALERGVPGRNYVLANEQLGLREMFERARAVSGVKGWLLPLPDWLLVPSMAFASLAERLMPLPRLLSSENTRGQLGGTTMLFDSSLARRELGWSPSPIDATLKEIMADELAKRGKPLPKLLEGVTPRLD